MDTSYYGQFTARWGSRFPSCFRDAAHDVWAKGNPPNVRAVARDEGTSGAGVVSCPANYGAAPAVTDPTEMRDATRQEWGIAAFYPGLFLFHHLPSWCAALLGSVTLCFFALL